MKLITKIYRFVKNRIELLQFKSSGDYWIKRYKKGGNSGFGSYGELAQFKADILNKFVSDQNIQRVIEYGCGDGHQLTLAVYPNYMGYDISPDAISFNCKNFSNDNTKAFFLMNEYHGETAELTLSLDVTYHLVEDKVFEDYLRLLFSSSTKYVIVYSTNFDVVSLIEPHIKHRMFTKWVENNITGWKLIEHIPNKLSAGRINTSKADFYFYQKTG